MVRTLSGGRLADSSKLQNHQQKTLSCGTTFLSLGWQRNR